MGIHIHESMPMSPALGALQQIPEASVSRVDCAVLRCTLCRAVLLCAEGTSPGCFCRCRGPAGDAYAVYADATAACVTLLLTSCVCCC